MTRRLLKHLRQCVLPHMLDVLLRAHFRYTCALAVSCRPGGGGGSSSHGGTLCVVVGTAFATASLQFLRSRLISALVGMWSQRALKFGLYMVVSEIDVRSKGLWLSREVAAE
eukprot:6456148-Amphidinium_carterae.1